MSELMSATEFRLVARLERLSEWFVSEGHIDEAAVCKAAASKIPQLLHKMDELKFDIKCLQNNAKKAKKAKSIDEARTWL